MKNKPLKNVPLIRKTDLTINPSGAGRIVQVVMNTNLRAGHEGLAKLAKDLGVDVKRLQAGQYLIFINSRQDKLKVYTANNIVAYWRGDAGQRVSLDALRYVPQAFQAKGQLDYDTALRQSLSERLVHRSVTQ